MLLLIFCSLADVDIVVGGWTDLGFGKAFAGCGVVLTCVGLREGAGRLCSSWGDRLSEATACR